MNRDTPEHYRRLQVLFTEVCDLPSIERSAILEACCPDADTRQEVVNLLERHDAANARDGMNQGRAVLPPCIGPYVLLELIAQGGMGRVYRAMQPQPHRLVALKVLRFLFASPDAVRRFEYEAEILARLQHTNIAQVFEAGSYDDGVGHVPWFSMELIQDARTITRYATDQHLSLTDRLDLFLEVCDAVHYGHQRGVLHRDLKPGNILVNSDGQAKVIDFGVAKVLTADNPAQQTELHQLIGTLQYMSPEQAGGANGIRPALDVRSDIYSLGAVLYELLCGHPPHDLGNASISQAIAIVTQQVPARPSTMDPRLRGDLDAIILMALQHRANDRYASVHDLAQDLRRFIAREPVIARTPSVLYQLHRFALRNRALVGGIAATGAALVIGLIASLYWLNQALRARDAAAHQGEAAIVARNEASQRADEVEKIADFQAQLLQALDPRRMGKQLSDELVAELAQRPSPNVTDVSAVVGEVNFTKLAAHLIDQGLLRQALENIDKQFGTQPVVRAQLLQTVAESYWSLGLYAQAFQPAERACELRLNHLGPLHQHSLYSRRWLGGLLLELGKYDLAESHLHAALDGYRQTQGDEVRPTLFVMHLLAQLHWHTNRLEEALDLAQKTYDIRQRLFDEHDPHTLQSLHVLANVLHTANRLEEALPYLQRYVQTATQILGPEDAATLMGMNNLAWLHSGLKHLPEAEALFLHVLERRQQLFGPEHAETINTMSGLAMIHHDAGRFEQAIPWRRQILHGWSQSLGPDHLSSLTSALNLALTLREVGAFDEAINLLTQALHHRRLALGESDFRTIHSLIRLAETHLMAGHFSEAALVAQQAVETAAAALPPNDRFLAYALCVRAEVECRLGHSRESEQLLHQVMLMTEHEPTVQEQQEIFSRKIRGATVPSRRWIRADAKYLLGLCRIHQARLDEAESLLAQGSEELYEDSAGPWGQKATAAEALRSLRASAARNNQALE